VVHAEEKLRTFLELKQRSKKALTLALGDWQTGTRAKVR
jgi:hypothetical protein